MLDSEYTHTLKPAPTLARFYDWVKQRKGQGLSQGMNNRQMNHTQDKEKEKKYVAFSSH